MMKRAQGWQVLYVNQKSKRITLSLAKLACILLCEGIRMEKYPPCIFNIALDDKLCIELQDE